MNRARPAVAAPLTVAGRALVAACGTNPYAAGARGAAAAGERGSGKSTCDGACARKWPSLLADGAGGTWHAPEPNGGKADPARRPTIQQASARSPSGH
ncbi:hypothetical protein [Amycolatopsis sp. cmx-4-61]|uniref:hypothetical protein n=1 Tax=Amycolatopsis sp. cmx-4-61 TaxID=2790937 RepID=UPI00397B8956